MKKSAPYCKVLNCKRRNLSFKEDGLCLYHRFLEKIRTTKKLSNPSLKVKPLKLKKKVHSAANSKIKEPTEWEDVLVKHKDIIDNMILAGYNGYYQIPLPRTPLPRYCKKLYFVLLDLPRKSVYPSCCLDKDDLYQTLSVAYWKYTSGFFKNKPDVSFEMFLIRLSYFTIRDLLVSLIRIPMQDISEEELLPPEEKKVELNLKFAFRGSKVSPLNKMTPLERYLLYLHLSKKESLEKIAKRVNRVRKTVYNHRLKLFAKLGFSQLDFLD